MTRRPLPGCWTGPPTPCAAGRPIRCTPGVTSPSDANPVSDLNNATDGDLFIAAALARAAVRWQRPDYAGDGRPDGARHTRPGPHRRRPHRAAAGRRPGSRKPDHFLLNPSYYAFGLVRGSGGAGAIPEMGPAAPGRDGADPARVAMASGCCRRIGCASERAERLASALRQAGRRASPGTRSGFRCISHGAALRPSHGVHVLFTGIGRLPADHGAGLGGFAHGGGGAVFRPCRHPRGRGSWPRGRSVWRGQPRLPPVMAATDYYGAGLILLSRIAAEEVAHTAAFEVGMTDERRRRTMSQRRWPHSAPRRSVTIASGRLQITSRSGLTLAATSP